MLSSSKEETSLLPEAYYKRFHFQFFQLKLNRQSNSLRLQGHNFQVISRRKNNRTCMFLNMRIFLFVLFCFLRFHENFFLKTKRILSHLQCICPRMESLLFSSILTKHWIRPNRSSLISWIIFTCHSETEESQKRVYTKQKYEINTGEGGLEPPNARAKT